MIEVIADVLAEQIRAAARFNEGVQVAPVAILWTDELRQWQSAMPLLKQQMPELIELGDYNAEQRIGPAVWIKCAIEHLLPELALPTDKTPVIYLPGIARKDLRAVELCPEPLQPLAELQYRGCWWSYPNGVRDWTVNSFLSSDVVGLGLDIAQDNKTQQALLVVLEQLLQEEPRLLLGKKLEAQDFNSLIASDPVKNLLQWMNAPEACQQQWPPAEWSVFESYCQDQLQLTPVPENRQRFAESLCEQTGSWALIWERFCDSARQYPQLLKLLETIEPMDLASHGSSYLSVNLQDEASLLQALAALKQVSVTEARQTIDRLYTEHSNRRDWLWTRLDRSPYLMMLLELQTVNQITTVSFTGPDAEAMAASYKHEYWQADNAAIRAMALAENDQQRALVADVLAVIYTPWLAEVATNFQQLVKKQGYPGSSNSEVKVATAAYTITSQVVFFVDGLRYDVGQQLLERLQSLARVELTSQWSALPSLTATAKAAVTPVQQLLGGAADNDKFEPMLLETGQPFSSHHFRKALEQSGWQYLEQIETGDPTGLAWLQTGDIDHAGHDEQLNLPSRIDSILDNIVARVVGLLAAGWQHIRIVTDHGWLWVPDQLPKAELPKEATRRRLVRCAIVKDNVATEHLTQPWYWNPEVTVAMAPGISGFTAGLYYDHGGLSLQECLTPVLNIRPKLAAPSE